MRPRKYEAKKCREFVTHVYEIVREEYAKQQVDTVKEQFRGLLRLSYMQKVYKSNGEDLD